MGRHEVEKLVSGDSARPGAAMLRCYLVASQSCCLEKHILSGLRYLRETQEALESDSKITHELKNRDSEENYRAQTGSTEDTKGTGENGAVENPHSAVGLDGYLSPQRS